MRRDSSPSSRVGWSVNDVVMGESMMRSDETLRDEWVLMKKMA